MNNAHLKELLAIEDEQLRKLNRIVLEAVEEEKTLSQKLHAFEQEKPGIASRMADKVAKFGGSWPFIVSFLLLMLLWMIGNTYWLSHPFDVYPFILLNLVLSTIAAIQAPIILMSQNRAEAKDRQRATNDYVINLKAEIEIRNIHQKLDLLISEQMKTMFELQTVQMDMIKELKTALYKK